MRDAVFAFLLCHYAGVCLTHGQANPIELAVGAAFGAIVFLVARGRPKAPRARAHPTTPTPQERQVMAKKTRTRSALDDRSVYPAGTEDGLSFRERMAKNMRLIGRTPAEIDQACDTLVGQMEALVAQGLFEQVVTPAGVAAYGPTAKLNEHLAAGGAYPLAGLSY